MTNYNERLEDRLKDLFHAGHMYGELGVTWEDPDIITLDIKQAITSLIAQQVREARIDENQMYIRELSRHYYPAGPDEPHIPLVQFHERIAELEGEK